MARRSTGIGVIAVLLLSAVGIRLWHDASSGQPPPNGDLPSLERFARDHPGSKDAQLNLGLALRDSGRTEEAGAALSRALELAPDDSRVHVALASVALKNLDRNSAKAHLQDALRLNPADVEAARILGDLYYKDNEIQPAIEAYRKVTELAPTDSDAWKQLGLVYRQTQFLPNAYQALHRAAELKPDDWEVNYNLSDLCMKLGYLDEARAAIERARKQKPNDPETATFVTMLAVRTESSPDALEQALKQIDGIIASKPNPFAYLVRGRVYLAQKRYGPAIDDLKKAIKMEPEMDPAYVYLSQAYARSGRPDLARQASNGYAAHMEARVKAMKAMSASSAGRPAAGRGPMGQ